MKNTTKFSLVMLTAFALYAPSFGAGASATATAAATTTASTADSDSKHTAALAAISLAPTPEADRQRAAALEAIAQAPYGTHIATAQQHGYRYVPITRPLGNNSAATTHALVPANATMADIANAAQQMYGADVMLHEMPNKNGEGYQFESYKVYAAYPPINLSSSVTDYATDSFTSHAKDKVLVVDNKEPKAPSIVVAPACKAN